MPRKRDNTEIGNIRVYAAALDPLAGLVHWAQKAETRSLEVCGLFPMDDDSSAARTFSPRSKTTP